MKLLHRLCFLIPALCAPVATGYAAAPASKWKYPTKDFPWVHIAKEDEVTMPASEGYLSPGGVKVKVPTPRALTTLAALESLNPGLSQTLPGLAVMMETKPKDPIVAAPEFDKLYQSKKLRVTRGKPLDEYNFFDCATVLRLKHPKTSRAILLIQADMDVDTDGSDPIRFASENDYADSLVSHSFLPMLSYRWDRSAPATHPLLNYFQTATQQLTQYQAQVRAGLENGSYPLWQRTVMRRVEEACEEEAAKLRRNFIRTDHGNTPEHVKDMRTSCSLLGPYDPFIVIPSNWFGEGKVAIGDLAAVIFNKKIYPALVADAGPTAQAGEASLKICRQIEPKSSGVFRAVNGPHATYIVFPSTAQGRPGPLKHDHMRDAIANLITEIGGPGLPAMIHAW